MPIEVRELTIRSSVREEGQGAGCGRDEGEAARDAQEMKDDILAECRRLVLELLAEKRER